MHPCSAQQCVSLLSKIRGKFVKIAVIKDSPNPTEVDRNNQLEDSALFLDLLLARNCLS